jgi:hypothetical protein
LNKPRPEPFQPDAKDPRRYLNKFHKRLLSIIAEGGGSAIKSMLIRMTVGRKRARNTRVRTRAWQALLGLEQAGYVTRHDNCVSLTVEGWLALINSRKGIDSGN